MNLRGGGTNSNDSNMNMNIKPLEVKEALTKEEKRSVLFGLAPALEMMESMRGKEIKECREATLCRSERQQFTGKYQYIDIITDQIISPKRYERKYLDYLKEKAQKLKKEKEKEISDTHLRNQEISSSNNSNNNINCNDSNIIETMVKSALLNKECKQNTNNNDNNNDKNNLMMDISRNDEESKKNTEQVNESIVNSSIFELDHVLRQEIAKHEGKLWKTMEDALGKYHRDVAALEASFRAKKISIEKTILRNSTIRQKEDIWIEVNIEKQQRTAKINCVFLFLNSTKDQ